MYQSFPMLLMKYLEDERMKELTKNETVERHALPSTAALCARAWWVYHFGSPPAVPVKLPLNCPKGYGLCWTCSTWCDQPGFVQQQSVKGDGNG
jgi:hypothetical protein